MPRVPPHHSRRVDQFWFTFFHEAGHILLGGKKETFIDLNHTKGPAEKEADRFAANHLIPAQRATELNRLKSDRAIEAFAQSVGIAPGIVVGRLQYEKIVRYDQFNGLKVRYQWTNNFFIGNINLSSWVHQEGSARTRWV